MSGKTKKNAHLWDRHPDDWYVEERFATRELLKREQFPSVIYDPCCGRGHILAEANLAGYRPIGSDIVLRQWVGPMDAYWAGAFDFLTHAPVVTNMGDVGVIMNPPFRHGDAAQGIEGFVRKAMTLPHVQKIAAFVPARFLWGKDRAQQFHQTVPATSVYMITPRPSCPPGPVWEDAPEEVGGGADEFAWMVWERCETFDCWPTPDHESPRLYWMVGDR